MDLLSANKAWDDTMHPEEVQSDKSEPIEALEEVLELPPSRPMTPTKLVSVPSRQASVQPIPEIKKKVSGPGLLKSLKR